MTIGVGVEGPSDRQFWNKVLHKHFRGVRFDIRNMSNKGNLIRRTPELLETFRNCHYEAGFILIDQDNAPCVKAVINTFGENIREEARKPLNKRFLFVCVAIRELEAWLLADEVAVRIVLPHSGYKVCRETGELNAEKKLKELWRKHYPTASLNKIQFAQSMAAKFQPDRASRRSKSFKHFWSRIYPIADN